jgi:hypothetical protein
MTAQGPEELAGELQMDEEEAALQAEGMTMVTFVNRVCSRRNIGNMFGGRRNIEDMYGRTGWHDFHQMIEAGRDIQQLYLEFERQDDHGNTYHSDLIIEAILHYMIVKTRKMVQMAPRTQGTRAVPFHDEAQAFIAACGRN